MINSLVENIFEKAVRAAKSIYGEPIGIGRHRIVFQDKDWVIKVPISASGVKACLEEIKTKDNRHAISYKDKMSKKLNLPIVRMEYVQHIGPQKHLRWTYNVDGGQIGITKDGRIVAYDWELET